jgi:hypothetical protein
MFLNATRNSHQKFCTLVNAQIHLTQHSAVQNRSSRHVFASSIHSASIIALVLLQGIFGLNGGTNAVMTHAKEGRFSNGKGLHHVYTGYLLIDDILPMSVGMWDPVLHQARPATLLSRTFSASVQSLGVFAMV